MACPIHAEPKGIRQGEDMTTHSDMLYHLGGVPVDGAFTTGNVFFVSSVTGSDGNTGKKPSQPFATLDKATNACTANNNDIVYIMPNHAETIAGATTWAPDVAGVQYIGIGLGADAPELTFSATGSKILASGGNQLFQNIRFKAGIASVAVGVQVGADHVTFDRCVWDYSTTLYNFTVALNIDGYDYCKVENCHFIGENGVATWTSGPDGAIRVDDAHNTVIRNNLIVGDYSKAAILTASTDAVSKQIMVLDNQIYNSDTGSTWGGGIGFEAANTGVISKNMVGWLTGNGSAAFPAIDPGSCLMFENYVCTAVDKFGVATIVGTATT